MAAIQEATLQLDMQSLRISGLGDPTAANDATKTDNTTSPANPAAAASAGASLKAAPADHVHQGVHSVRADGNANLYGDVQLVSGSGVALSQSGNQITVAVSGGAANKIGNGDARQFSNVGTTEEIVAEWNENFDDAGGGTGTNIQARLSALVKAAAGTGTFKIYVGATNPGDTTGGTVRATLTTTNTAFEKQSNQGSAFTNPGGQRLVQVTVSNSGSNKSTIRGIDFAIG